MKNRSPARKGILRLTKEDAVGPDSAIPHLWTLNGLWQLHRSKGARSDTAGAAPRIMIVRRKKRW